MFDNFSVSAQVQKENELRSLSARPKLFARRYNPYVRLINALKIGGVLRTRNVIFGYRLFDKPNLVSFPRSGTNWLRYFVETLTGLPTPGEERLFGGNEYCMDRCHAGFATMSRYDKVILVLRDYKECLIRHHGLESIRSHRSIGDYLVSKDYAEPPGWYWRNLATFDIHHGQKLLLYYEDLVREPESSLRNLANFLQLDQTALDEFLKNLEHHRKASIREYTKHSHVSMTTGEDGNIGSHAKGLSIREKISFDEWFETNSAGLSKPYLARYVTVR